MNPNYDIDSRTAKLAARLIFEAVDAINSHTNELTLTFDAFMFTGRLPFHMQRR